MELLQLRYFQLVAKLQHMTKAAKELNVSQPSLSMMIAKIENELGTPLFIRKGRNIILNEYGEAFLNHVNIILNEIENSKQEIKNMIDVCNKQIIIEATSASILTGVLREFMCFNSDCTIRQSIGSIQEIESHLKTGEIDFAITFPPIQNQNMESILLKEEALDLVVPVNHRFANRNSINLQEVSSDSFICMIKNSGYRELTDNLCQTAGFTPNVIFEGDFQLMSELLLSGSGISLVPESLCKIYSNPLIKFLKIDSPICQRTISLSYQKNKYLSSYAIFFKNFVIDYYRNF